MTSADTSGRRGRIGQDPGTGRYYFVVDVAPPGAARRQLKRRFRTRREAQRALTAVLADLHRGTFVTPSALTLRDYVEERWLPSLAVRPTTLASYARNLRLHVLPTLGELPLQRLDRARIDGLHQALLRGGRRDHAAGTPLSLRTVRYVHTILRSALERAVEWELLVRNPCPRRAPGERQRSEAPLRAWEPAQAREFLAAVHAAEHAAEHADEHAALWHLLLVTGLRRGEALGLGWDHVDLVAGTLRIERTLVDVAAGDPVWSTPKTDRGRRTIHLDAGTVDVLRRHRREQAVERLAAERWEDHGLVFAVRPAVAGRPGRPRSAPPGSPLHPDRLSRTFAGVLRRAGLPPIRLHDLRHTAATLHLAAGTPVRVVSELLGHATTAITNDVYTHVPGSVQRAATERLAALITERR